MNNINKEQSCYSTSLIVKYAQANNVDLKELFNDIEEFRSTIENPLEWIDTEILIKFLQNLVRTLGSHSNIIEKIAKEITEKQISNYQLLFFKIVPLSIIIKNVSNHVEKNISKTVKVSANLIRNGLIDVYFTPKDKSKISDEICGFNKGCTYATLKLKGLKNLTLIEETCSARDANAISCHYKITWTPQPNIFHKIKNFFFFRFRDQKAIIQHMEENHQSLEKQYKEILSIKDFYSHIMDNMGEGVLWLDIEGKITFANKGFSIISEYSQEELEGKFFWDFLSASKTTKEYQGIFSDIRSTPFVSELKEFVIDTKGGERRIGLASLVWVSSELQKPGFLVSIRDITEQKKVERQLFASENRYKSLYENSPALIVGLDLDGNFIYANPAMEEASSYSEKELITMHFGDLVAPDADFDVMRLFRGRLDKGARLQEVHIKTKSGEWKAIALNTYPVKDNMNMIAGVAGIGVDITETKRLNEQLVHSQRMDMLGKMAGGLAHDFKNLLSVVIGYGGLIHAKAEDKSFKKYAHNILKASERATELTKSLLTFSRGEIVKRKKFNINRLLHEVKNFAAPIVPSNITINAQISKDQYYMRGDPGKIHQCVLNLCINAKDAIGDSPGEIVVRLVEANKEEMVFIEVEDNGPGIPPDIIEHIFDPFFSTKKKRQGTGLGLSVVYGAIKSHNGDISIQSRPGEGTIFRIEMPTISIHEEEERPREIVHRSGVVMVIDDDDLMREFCNESLKGVGYKAVQFSDSKKALTWFGDNYQEVLFSLVDIQMPHMDGVEMVKEFRKINDNVKVIYMSGYLPPELELTSDVDPFLEKPFTSDALADTIDSILYSKAGS